MASGKMGGRAPGGGLALDPRGQVVAPSDGGAQDLDDTTDDYYYPEGAPYYVETADAGSQGSQAVMERGDQQSAKKPRLAAEPLLHAPVKQEIVVHQPAGDATEDLQDAAELTADGMAVDARRPVRHPNQRGDVACPRSGDTAPMAAKVLQLRSSDGKVLVAPAWDYRPTAAQALPLEMRVPSRALERVLQYWTKHNLAKATAKKLYLLE
uniref:Uncharacterized protein n=1 Tax=Aegilops tauschii TaxID=37682 RepID=M8AR78_AEGTA